MVNKDKYPIGTRIRFVNDTDKGLRGKVVGYKGGYYLVYLPKSGFDGSEHNEVKYTWICTENDFVLLKNEQLLFEFMSNEE